MPFIAKDGIKERLFETLGWSYRAWSRRLGVASIAVLYDTLERILAAGCSCVTESVFRLEYDDEPLRGCVRATARVRSISSVSPKARRCGAAGGAVESGTRHPGHVEPTMYDEVRPGLLRGRSDPLHLAGPLVEVDTTDFAAVDYDALITALRTAWQMAE